MKLSLEFSAMMLFLLQILVFCSEVVYILVVDADQVAKTLKVSDFDCSAMTENTFYALNEVQLCHIRPDELETLQTKIKLYAKQFRKDLSTTKCRIQHQKWHCV